MAGKQTPRGCGGAASDARGSKSHDVSKWVNLECNVKGSNPGSCSHEATSTSPPPDTPNSYNVSLRLTSPHQLHVFSAGWSHQYTQSHLPFGPSQYESNSQKFAFETIALFSRVRQTILPNALPLLFSSQYQLFANIYQSLCDSTSRTFLWQTGK